MSAALALLRRDLRLAWAQGGGVGVGVVFFLILVTLLPFSVGPDQAVLRRIAPAMLWIGALLATLLALDRLFQADEEDGSLDLLAAAPLALETVVAMKCLAHWLTAVLPLVVAAPVLGLMLALPPAALPGLVGSLLVGTPALTAAGAIGAALTVSVRRGGLLLAILVLPGLIPLLIFGVAAAAAAAEGWAAFRPPFLVLAGLSLATLVLAPIAAAAALRAARA